MKITKIAELLEKEIINVAVENLEDKIIKTDFGICLNENKEQVYRTHFSITLDFIQDTPVSVCKIKKNPVEVRMMSDRDRVKLLVKELFGL